MSPVGSRGEVGAARLLQDIANQRAPLSDALRQTLLLPAVQDESDLRTWINHEVSGYDPGVEIPEYRRAKLPVHGDAANLAYRITGTPVPLTGMPDVLREYGEEPHEFREGIDELERLLRSGNNTFEIPWDPEVVALINGTVGRGGTAIHDSYRFGRVYWLVPAGIIQGIVNRVRQRCLNALIELVPADQRILEIAEEVDPDVRGGLSVAGSGNQIMIGSPGASQRLSVAAGDWASLSRALLAIGISEESLDELKSSLDAATDEDSKILKAVRWAQARGLDLGVSAAGSAIASLLLQYLGAV